MIYDRILNDRNNPSSEEKNKILDPSTAEYKELSFHFNTIFNDISIKSLQSEAKLYEIERAYPLNNKFISLNFQKRELTEITAYGWFVSEALEEKRIEELVSRYKTRGPDKIDKGIYVTPPTIDEVREIILCKFIVGNSLVLIQPEDIDINNPIYSKYDTIVKVEQNNNNQRKYYVKNIENIELLYLLKIKETAGEFESKLITCSNPNCKNKDKDQPAEPSQSQNKIYFCALKEDYLCEGCHNEEKEHSNQIMGEFKHSNCEQKTVNNMTGICENPLHTKKESVDFFCQECNKGICAYCKIYGDEKHGKLDIISTLFNENNISENPNKEFKLINDYFNKKADSLGTIVTDIQNNNNKVAESLKTFTTRKFKELHDTLEKMFEEDGEKFLAICFRLNFIKDFLWKHQKYYTERENFLKNNNLRQELLWTKKLHFENLRYLIALKENIDTDILFKEDKYDKTVNNYIDLVSKEILNRFGKTEEEEIKPTEEKDEITIDYLLEEAKIDNNSTNK